MSLTLYLVRHAETEVNLGNRIGGQSNWAELTENGKRQAQALGHLFKEEKIQFDDVYSSPAVRTQQTARYCFETMYGQQNNAKPTLTKKIMELDQGDWEGKIRNEVYKREDVRKNLDNNNWKFLPGDKVKGESQFQVAMRMKNWLMKLIQCSSGKDIIAFSHGLAIKFLLTELFDFDRSTAFQIPIDNTSVTVIRYEEKKFTCIKQNDTKHLEKFNLTKVLGAFDIIEKK